MKQLYFAKASENSVATYAVRKAATYYSFGGVVLPEPPDGINGHMTLVDYGSMYAMFYGTLYGTPSSMHDESGILACYVGEEPVAYTIDAGASAWKLGKLEVEDDNPDAIWLSIPQGGTFVWTSDDIYLIDDNLLIVTSTIAHQGTAAELYIPPDDGSTSLMVGWLAGQMIRGMRNQPKEDV